MKNKPNVYIIDPSSYVLHGTRVGHYFGVAENLLKVLSPTFNTYVTGGPVYGERFKDNCLILPHNTLPEQSVLRQKWLLFMNMRSVYKRTKESDILIWQSVSVLTILIGMLFVGKKRNNFLIQYNKRCMSNAFYRFLFALVRPKISGVICTLEDVGKVFEKLPYVVIPDYIYTKDTKVDILPYVDRQYDFCVVGLLCEDKGVVEVVRKLRGSRYSLLVAGKPANEAIRKELEELAENQSNVTLMLEYLSQEKYDYYITHSKYCLLNYSGAYSEHSSGVVCDVIFKGTPIVGKDCKSFRFIKEYKVGCVYKELDEWEPATVLEEDKHREYVDAIQNYYVQHEHYRQELITFLTRVSDRSI